MKSVSISGKTGAENSGRSASEEEPLCANKNLFILVAGIIQQDYVNDKLSKMKRQKKSSVVKDEYLSLLNIRASF